MLPDNHPSDDGPLPDWLPPLLIIDWGVEPQAGKDLTPEFRLLTRGYHHPPRITAILDKRLDQEHWQQNPPLSECGECDWKFFEQLELTRGGQVCRSGQFLLQFQVIFPEPGPSGIRCFRASVRVTIQDTSQSDNPVLEIRADDSSLVNLQGLDINRYAKIVVQSSQQGIVNVLHEAVAGSGSQADSSDAPPPDQRLVVQLLLEPHRELQRLIPCFGQSRWAPPMDAASLDFDDGRCIHLLAREHVFLGRDGSGATPSDIMLRLFPLDDHRWTLTRLISRQHLRLAVDQTGLRLQDCRSTFGTYLDDQALIEPQTVILPALWRMLRRTLDIAGLLRLRLTVHHDPGWDAWRHFGDTGEAHYAAVAGCGIPPLWHHAAASNIDAVRIERCPALSVAHDLSRIESVLMPEYCQQWETVSQAAAAVEPIDRLAGREQYVLLYRSAVIGGSEETAIWLPGAGLNGVPARILHLGGRFWLESLVSDQAVSLNDRLLDPQELVLLVPEDRLQIGSVELTFSDFRQLPA